MKSIMCDRCGRNNTVVLTKLCTDFLGESCIIHGFRGYLAFCPMHYKRYRALLTLQGWEII